MLTWVVYQVYAGTKSVQSDLFSHKNCKRDERNPIARELEMTEEHKKETRAWSCRTICVTLGIFDVPGDRKLSVPDDRELIVQMVGYFCCLTRFSDIIVVQKYMGVSLLFVFIAA